MATAFQIDAFQNNAFQIIMPLAASLNATAAMTADLVIVEPLAASLAGTAAMTADLRELWPLTARLRGVAAMVAGASQVEFFEAVLTAVGLMLIDEGHLLDTVTLVAEAINPATITVSAVDTLTVTLVAEAVNVSTVTVQPHAEDTVEPQPATNPDTATLVRG